MENEFDNLMIFFKTVVLNPVNPSNPSIRGQNFFKTSCFDPAKSF